MQQQFRWNPSPTLLNGLDWHITKTRLYNVDPLKLHFYIVKLGFTGVYIIFLISAQNIDCGYSLELPRRGGSYEYPQSMFWAEIWKISRVFLSENFQFLEVKFSRYLNRCVFVMMCVIFSISQCFLLFFISDHWFIWVYQRYPGLMCVIFSTSQCFLLFLFQTTGLSGCTNDVPVWCVWFSQHLRERII